MSLALLRNVLPLIVLLPFALRAAEQSDTTPSSAADAPQWVSKLNSDDFDERTAAAIKLAALGETAREALEKAAAGTDPDIRTAAAELLSKLSRATLSVLTTDRDGKPLAGLQADLTIYKDMNNGNQQSIPITTRDDGTAQLFTNEPGTYNVYMAWKKCTPATNSYAIPYSIRHKLTSGPTRLTVMVSEGGTCEASAIDADGKPLKEARICLCPTIDIGDHLDDSNFLNRMGGMGQLSQSTDEHGKARLENVPDGVYRAIWTHDTSESTLGPVVRIREKQNTVLPPATLKPKNLGSLQVTLNKADDKPLEKGHFFYSLIPTGDDPAVQRRAMSSEYMQHLSNNGQSVQTTDEHGKATLENLKAGKYHLIIRTTNSENNQVRIFRGNGNDQTEGMTEFSADVEIKSGAGAAPELTLKPNVGSSLRGKIVNEKGEAHGEVNLALVDERYLAITGILIFTQNYYDPAGMYSRYAQNKQDGSFELAHVRPGKYALAIHARTGEAAVMYGIEVVEGKDTDIPLMKLPSNKTPVSEVKGKVLLPNGVPAVSAPVYLETITTGGNNSSSGVNTNQKGEFAFSSAYFAAGNRPNRLKVQLPGYHPVTLNLTSADVKVDDLVLNLAKRDYGSLCIKTVDDAGKPVAGVKIWPTPSFPWYYSGRQNVSRMQRTDAAGEAHFKGMSDGARKMQIECEGYFTDPDSTPTVKPGDEETVFTAVLHTGLKVIARLDLPPDVPLGRAGVMLQDNLGTVMWSTARPDGSFEFIGLKPGTYMLHACVPGCSPSESIAPVVLTPELKAPLTVSVKMLHTCGVAINAGAENAGASVHLFAPDLFKHGRIDEIASRLLYNRSDMVDGEGRAEFPAPPGNYQVMFSNPLNYWDGTYGNYNRVTVLNGAGNVTAGPLASIADASKLPAQTVTRQKSTASVVMTVVPEIPEGVPNEKLKPITTFLILGENAAAYFYFNRQMWQQSVDIPNVIGTPPPELLSKKENRYTAKHLLPGKYKIWVITGIQGKDDTTGAVPLTEFTLEADQNLDLGTLKFTVPRFSRDENAQVPVDFFGLDGADDDKVDLFKP